MSSIKEFLVLAFLFIISLIFIVLPLTGIAMAVMNLMSSYLQASFN